MIQTIRYLIVGIAAAASTTLAFATPISPGGATVVATNNITVTNDGTLGSISGTLTARTFTGTYTESVIKDGSNPYGADDLTFLITLSSSSSSLNGIEHISNGDGAASFAWLPTVNVGYLSGSGEGGSDFPLTIDETTFGTIEFNFSGSDTITPGTGTQYLAIQTAATQYAMGDVAAIDSSSDTENGFVPLATTPEPGSFALLGTGFLVAGGALRRRHRRAA